MAAPGVAAIALPPRMMDAPPVTVLMWPAGACACAYTGVAARTSTAASPATNRPGPVISPSRADLGIPLTILSSGARPERRKRPNPTAGVRPLHPPCQPGRRGYAIQRNHYV